MSVPYDGYAVCQDHPERGSVDFSVYVARGALASSKFLPLIDVTIGGTAVSFPDLVPMECRMVFDNVPEGAIWCLGTVGADAVARSGRGEDLRIPSDGQFLSRTGAETCESQIVRRATVQVQCIRLGCHERRLRGSTSAGRRQRHSFAVSGRCAGLSL